MCGRLKQGGGDRRGAVTPATGVGCAAMVHGADVFTSGFHRPTLTSQPCAVTGSQTVENTLTSPSARRYRLARRGQPSCPSPAPPKESSGPAPAQDRLRATAPDHANKSGVESSVFTNYGSGRSSPAPARPRPTAAERDPRQRIRHRGCDPRVDTLHLSKLKAMPPLGLSSGGRCVSLEMPMNEEKSARAETGRKSAAPKAERRPRSLVRCAPWPSLSAFGLISGWT